MHFTRYAVYYTPPEGAFSEFGAAWLGWDATRGTAVAHPDMAGLPVAEITETPRKYGLHATMKPPFRLTDGQDEAGLRDAFARFCAQARPVLLDGLTVTALGRFLTLMPEGDTSALDALAACRNPKTRTKATDQPGPVCCQEVGRPARAVAQLGLDLQCLGGVPDLQRTGMATCQRLRVVVRR